MDIVTLTVSNHTQMSAYAARPSAIPQKGLIVFQEAFGITAHIRAVADRFAAQGFLVVAPELFHRTAAPGMTLLSSDYDAVRPHMQAITPEGLIADAKVAYDWLLGEGVPEGKVAAIGFCLGGRTAYLANSALPLAVAVSFYGGGIAELLDRAKDLHGPHLFIWGGQDASIPPEQTQAIAEALRSAGKPFTEKTFPEAGHAFMREGDPSRYHEASAHEAFALVDSFFAEHVG